MELLEVVNLQFALPIAGVLCLAILVFLFGFRAPIQPPVIAENVVVALRKTKSKVSNKQSKKVVANHSDTHSEGTKLQAPVSNKAAKKPTDKNDLNTTVRVPGTLVQNKSKDDNVVDKDAELSKENDWMLATTKKVKKDRVKHNQEHERDVNKSASAVLKEAKSNVGTAVKEISVAAVMEKPSKAVSQNNVSLEALAKQQKKAVEPEVSNPQPTQPKEAALAVMTNANGSAVRDKEAAAASKLSPSSSKASEIIPAEAEKGDQSKKKGKKDKQPVAVEQTKSLIAPDIKPVATAAKETTQKITAAEQRYHQVAVKAASEPEQKTTASKKNKSKKAEKGGADGAISSVVEKETGESIATDQQPKEANVQSSEQTPQSDLNSLEWEEIKAPKKKKKLRLD